MPTTQSGWKLLERYSRMRQRRFALPALPDDVLELIVSHLGAQDVLNLASALCGGSLRLDDSAHAVRAGLERLPLCMRRTWYDFRVLDDFELYVRTVIGDCAFFMARDALSIVLVADWSPFSRRPIEVLAEYAWTEPQSPETCGFPSLFRGYRRATCLTVNRPNVYRALLRAEGAGMHCMRLQMHQKCYFHDSTVVHPEPLASTVYHFAPAATLSGRLDGMPPRHKAYGDGYCFIDERCE